MTKVNGGDTQGVINVIGVVGGMLNGKTTLAFSSGTITSPLIKRQQQTGSKCCCCFIGGCHTWIRLGCDSEPTYGPIDFNADEIVEIMNILEYDIRPNFNPNT